MDEHAWANCGRCLFVLLIIVAIISVFLILGPGLLAIFGGS